MPAPSPGLLLEDLDLVAAALAPAEVHAKQHLGPVLRLESARAGVNAHDGVAGVVLAAEHLTHLEAGDALVDALRLLGHAFRERVRVAFDGELEEDAGVVELAALALPAVERRGQLRAFTLDLLGPLVIVPEVGLPDLLVEDLRRASVPGTSKMPLQRLETLLQRRQPLLQLVRRDLRRRAHTRGLLRRIDRDRLAPAIATSARRITHPYTNTSPKRV